MRVALSSAVVLLSVITSALAADITVKVASGVVTLKGRTNMFMGRQQAALVASLVNGATRVDNRIRVDESLPPRTSRVQAEK